MILINVDRRDKELDQEEQPSADDVRCKGTAGRRHSYWHSFTSTAVDNTQLYTGAEIKWDGDRTEKKVNVIYI